MTGPSLSGNLRGLILGILTIGLLGLYAWLVFAMICTALAAGHEPTERVSYLITTLQSLVSALVIAVLAISPPKGPVRLSFLGVGDDGDAGAQWIAVLYVLV